jgi:aryl sulfotransferase
MHVYQNHHLDSTMWNQYKPRVDDIVITTSIKSGTTWMQGIVGNLIFQEEPIPSDASLWPDKRWEPGNPIAALDAQTHRRFIKTHLALDGLPYYPDVKYIVVGRDARDVFMSYWNHYSSYTDAFYRKLNDEVPDRVGAPLPRCPQNIHECWHNWITRGWFAWESEGYPFWGNLHHTQSWWNYRHLDNLLFVHYADLLTDLAGEIKRIADFLDITTSNATVATVVERVSLTAMRRKAEESGAYTGFKGGPSTFFYKGTNGRWKDVLSAGELELYHAAVARELTPNCAVWLEVGRQAW